LLDQGFDAVFTATGGWDSRMARNESAPPAPVFPGAHLLIDLVRPRQDGGTLPDFGHRAVIAGGGRYLATAVQVLLDRGVKQVFIASRDPDPATGLDTLDPAAADAVTVLCRTGITRVTGAGESLTAVEAVDLDSGETRIIETTALIIGAGRFPELVFVPVSDPAADSGDAPAAGPLAWEGVELPKKPDTRSAQGLLSRQDVVSEYPAAVSAINGGRRAAAAMHHLMYKLPFQDPSLMVTGLSRLQDITELHQVEKAAKNISGLAARTDGIGSGFSEPAARSEAQRCLQCGLICYEKTG
jgi:formate dehydrogenase (NADP+) beta subunit